MGKNKLGRPSWFKLFLHHKSLIDAVPDEVAGSALKAALRYFDTGEVVELDSLARAVFAALKPHIDEAFADFQATSEKNTQNIQKRWANRGIPSDTTGNHSLPNDTKNTEAEAEAEAETEGEGEGYKADKPPSCSRFSTPTIDEVRAYCAEKGYTVDADRFVDYYTSNGWKVGKNPMKDWKAAVRTWNGKEQPNGKTEHKPLWTVGTTV